MKETVDIFLVLKRNLPMFVGLFLCAYFSYHAMFGNYGYSQIQNLSPISIAKERQLSALISKSSYLESRVSLLRPDSLSVDVLEEQVRLILGYNYDNEFVIVPE